MTQTLREQMARNITVKLGFTKSMGSRAAQESIATLTAQLHPNTALYEACYKDYLENKLADPVATVFRVLRKELEK